MSDDAAECVAEEFVKEAGLLKMIQNITRPANTFSTGSFAGSNTFTGLDFEEEINLKAGAYAAAGGLRSTVVPFKPAQGADKAAKYVAKDTCAPDPEVLKTIQNIKRPGNTFAQGSYAGAGTFAEGNFNPKAGAYAAAGVGYARAEWSVLSAEAKGPNASAGVGVSVACGARAFARAELAGASASAGPLKVKVGLAADTGFAISSSQIEAKVLGTGFSIGLKTSVSVLGTGFEIDF